MNDLKAKYKDYLDSGIRLTSVELIHLLIRSDSFMQKIEHCLNGFKTILLTDLDDLRHQENELVQQLKNTNSDLKTLIESNSHPQIVKLFFDILIEKIKTANGIESASEFLKTHDLQHLSKLIRGGIPYFDQETLNLNTTLQQEDLSLPDYMTSKNGDRSQLKEDGNDDWIDWLRNL